MRAEPIQRITGAGLAVGRSVIARRIWPCAVALAVSMFLPHSARAADVREGLVSYWPLDTLAADWASTPDLVSSNHLLAMVFDPSAVVAGQRGMAFAFDGDLTQRYLYHLTPAETDTGLPICRSPHNSVVFWVKGKGTGQTDRNIFSQSSSTTTDPMIDFGTHSAATDDSLDIYVRNSGTQINHARTGTPLDDQWHHIAWTDAAGLIKVYIDGQLTYTNSITHGATPSEFDTTSIAATVRLSSGTPYQYFFTGLIDEVAVWERALPQEEIQQVMTNGIQTPVPAFAPFITLQPQGATNLLVSDTFTLTAGTGGTRPLTYQWTKGATPITGANLPTLTLTNLQVSDSGDYTLHVENSMGSVTTLPATLLISVDVIIPTIVSARGSSDLSTVTISYSEDMDPTSTTDLANYSVSPSLTLSNPQMIGTRAVQFTTSLQALGTEYTITVNNVKDDSSAANPVAPNSQIKFRGIGPIQQRDDGYVVFEVELYDRLLGSLWRQNTARGTPSGGMSMEMPDNVSDSEANDQILFDVNFVHTGTHYVWYRAAGNDGNADSCWFHLDGARPVERANANEASMAGFNVGATGDFVWRSDAQEGSDPYTVEIPSTGLHVIGVASREDGAMFDKMVISTNAAYQPTGLGPNPTPRLGEPALPSDLQITLQPTNATAYESRPVSFTTAATTGDPALSYQWQRQEGAAFQDIAGANSATFTLNPATLAWNGAVLRCQVSIPGDVRFTDEVTLTVISDPTPPTALSAGAFPAGSTVGVAFDERLEGTTATAPGNYQVSGTTVSAATLRAEKFVELTLSSPVGASFTVTVSGVQDLAGNTVTNTTINGEITDLLAEDLGTVTVDPLEPGTAVAIGGGGFYVAAGGSDLWAAADAGYHVYKQFTGPFDVRVRVDSLRYGDEWGKAALMARESLAAGSRNQAVLITKNGPYPTPTEPAPGPYADGGVNVYNHQWRDATDGTCGSKAAGERISPTVFPSWLRLVRESTATNEIKSYLSYDGQAWISYHTHTTSDPLLPETLYLGMAATAHDNTAGFARAEAVYRSFSVVPFVPVVDPNLRIASAAGSVTISWDAGTLLSSATVDGQYQPVAGATSPHTVTPSAGTATFFRVLLP